MTDLKSTHDAITEMTKTIWVAQIQLAGLILSVCPGPHRPVQHRDHRPAWCRVCGYTTTGERFEPASEGPKEGQ